jgi:hypothetical protein
MKTQSWQGSLKFKTYNPRKVKKYGVLSEWCVGQYTDVYLLHKYISSKGKEVVEHSISTFREKLRTESTHLSREFLK